MNNTPQIDLYEDNAGGLWLVHSDTATLGFLMPPDGDFVTDVLSYDDWSTGYIAEFALWDDFQDPGDPAQLRHVATYHLTDSYIGGAPREGRLWMADHLGNAAREYLRHSLDTE